jgi:hypothetical protein
MIQTKSYKTEWDGDYNGEDGVLNIRTDTNGHSKEVRIEFDNNDLAKLLTIPHVNEPLQDRLKTAFFSEEGQGQEPIKEPYQDTSFPLIPLKSIAHLDIVTSRKRDTKKKRGSKRVRTPKRKNRKTNTKKLR